MGFYSRPVCSCPTFQHACPPSLLSGKCDVLALLSVASLSYQTAQPLTAETRWLGLHPSIFFAPIKSNSPLSRKYPYWQSSVFCLPWIYAIWSVAASTSFVSVRSFSSRLSSLLPSPVLSLERRRLSSCNSCGPVTLCSRLTISWQQAGMRYGSLLSAAALNQ